VLLVGVPHPNEPIGTLTIDFLTRALCEREDLRAELDVTLHAIPVADPDGFALNEGWFGGTFSPLRYALEFYRPPHREQVEWSFPVDYKTLQFGTPSPETATVMRVMERVRPELFYSLHNAGFCGVYFYMTHARPKLISALHALVRKHGLPLHHGEPEVPYLRTLAPAVYELFGIQDTYDYLERSLGEDPAPLLEAGTSSDDWLKRVCDAFSLVCELPYYTARALDDVSPAGCSRRDAIVRGVERAADVHQRATAFFARIGDRVPEHRLTRSVQEYLKKSPKRLAARRADACDRGEYSRDATRAEAVDAGVCAVFYHALYLGEIHRLAGMVGDHGVADEVHAYLTALMSDIAGESELTVLPLRPLVSVQAGAALVALGMD
jgi:hypothetical protein